MHRCKFLREYSVGSPHRKAVKQIDPATLATVRVFPSIAAASKVHGSGGNISEACHGRRKIVAGFIWQFQNGVET